MALVGGLLLALGQASARGQTNPVGTVLWQRSLREPIWPSPAIGANGALYVAGVGTLYAIDGTSGSDLWKFTTNRWAIGSPSVGADGTVYAGLGGIHALEGVNGSVKWTFATGVGFATPPAFGLDGTVFAGCRNGVLYVLDGTTGEKKREFVSGGAFSGTAAIGEDGTVYMGSWDTNVYAFDGVTGLTKWRFTAGGAVAGSAVIGSDGAVYIGAEDKYLYALNGSTGEKRWRFQTGTAVRATPALGPDGTVYLISDDKTLYALDGATGAKKWDFYHGTTAYSTPALAADGTLWMSAAGARLYALDTANGGVKSRLIPLACPELTGLVPSPVINTNGVLYFAASIQIAAVVCGAGPANSPWPMLGQNPQHANHVPPSAPPQIVAEPEDQTVVLGGKVVFKVEAAPNGSLLYRWQKDGVDMVSETRITGAESAWLCVKDVVPQDAGHYSVLISNRWGQVSSHGAVLELISGQPGSLRWKFGTGPAYPSEPTVGTNHTLYFTADGHLFALNTSNGEKRWQFNRESRDGWPLALGDNGWVYAGGSTAGELSAVEGATGALQWVKKVAAAYTMAPSIAGDGTVYLASGDKQLYAVDGLTGLKKWAFDAASAVDSKPAIGADETVYLRSRSGTLFGLDPVTGTRKWAFPSATNYSSNPALGRDGTLYFGSEDHQVYAVDGAAGKTTWTFTTGDMVHSSPALGPDGTVYVGSDDKKLYALDGATGAKKWEFTAAGAVEDPAVAADGTVYAGTADGSLYALDGLIGVEKWRFVTGTNVLSSPTIGPDGTVYISSRDGWVYAIIGSAPPAQSSWPMYGGDPQHTGRSPKQATPLRFLRATLSAGKFELAWEGTGGLQYAHTIHGPWQDIPVGTGTVYQTAPEAAQGFFRLKGVAAP